MTFLNQENAGGSSVSTVSDAPRCEREPEAESLLDWRNNEVALIKGAYEKTDVAFRSIKLGEVNVLATLIGPTTVAKNRAEAIIPSSYHAKDARDANVQEKNGSYVASILDIDKGNYPLERVVAAVREAVGEGVAFWVHSTASASELGRRWRVVIPLDGPYGFHDWRDCGEVICRRVEKAGIIVDRSMLKPNQISYLPNVPPEFCDAKGRPLFYESSDQDGDGLPWRVVEEDVDSLRSDRAMKALKRSSRSGRQDSVIDAFNAQNDIRDLLIKYGYERHPRGDKHWRSPHQGSNSYATRVTDGDGREIFQSHSASDAEAGLGAKGESGCLYGDAFELYAHFEHAGDFKAAIRAAAADLGMTPNAPAGPIPRFDSADVLPPMPEPFPGVMAEVVSAALATSPKPQPDLATLATLIAMASKCDGYNFLPSGARLNLYGLGVGGTGTGKDTPQTIVKSLAVAAEVRLFGEAGSGQGLEDHIESYEGALMVVDEISTTLAATCAKNAPAHLKSAEGMYLKLFSAGRSVYTTRLLAVSTTRTSGKTIRHPCVSLLGFATPDGLGSALGEGAITSGLLGRMLMARADDGVALRRVKSVFQLPDIVGLKVEAFEKRLIDFYSSKDDRHLEIKIPADVNARLDKLAPEMDAAMRRAPTEGERALLVRSYEKLERIAGVLAVWDDPSSPEITHEIIDWAEAFVRSSDAAIISFVRRYMHGSPVHANASRIKEMVIKVLAGEYKTDRPNEQAAVCKGYAPRSLVMRLCKTLGKQVFDLGVEQLVGQGDLVETTYSVSGGRPGLKVLTFPASGFV